MKHPHEVTHQSKGVIFRPLLLVSLLAANIAGGICEVKEVRIWISSIIYVTALLSPHLIAYVLQGFFTSDFDTEQHEVVPRLPSTRHL